MFVVFGIVQRHITLFFPCCEITIPLFMRRTVSPLETFAHLHFLQFTLNTPYIHFRTAVRAIRSFQGCKEKASAISTHQKASHECFTPFPFCMNHRLNIFHCCIIYLFQYFQIIGVKLAYHSFQLVNVNIPDSLVFIRFKDFSKRRIFKKRIVVSSSTFFIFEMIKSKSS